jgi:two-component system nitrate/nitrite response regulator NarL
MITQAQVGAQLLSNNGRKSICSTNARGIYLFSVCELRRVAIQHICCEGDEFYLIEAFKEFPADFETVTKIKPDLVIIDMTLLVGSRSDSIENVLQRVCGLSPVLILSDHLDIPFACTIIAYGASGYLLTSDSIEEMLQAFHVVVSRGIWLGRALARVLAHQLADTRSLEVSRNPHLLSQRERQILNYVAAGKTGKEIARELYLSESSVRTYWYRVMTKLNALNKAEAVAHASRLGLLDFVAEEDNDVPVMSPRLKAHIRERIQKAPGRAN